MGPLEWFLGSGTVLIGAGIGAWFRFGPGARVGAVADAILGSPPVKDRHGGLIDAGSPGLVQRVSTLEDAIKLLVDQRADILDLHVWQAKADLRLTSLERSIIGLAAAAAERTAMHQETTAALNLVRDEQTLTAEQTPEVD